MERDFSYIQDAIKDDRLYILVIYDITDNKKRARFAQYLQGYGVRIQKSAFEARLKIDTYHKMLKGISKFVAEEDNIRVYKIIGNNQIRNYGKMVSETVEQIIIL